VNAPLLPPDHEPPRTQPEGSVIGDLFTLLVRLFFTVILVLLGSLGGGAMLCGGSSASGGPLVLIGLVVFGFAAWGLIKLWSSRR
jgi:hypothetical protein